MEVGVEVDEGGVREWEVFQRKAGHSRRERQASRRDLLKVTGGD